MAVESHITDPQNKKKAEVDDADETEKRSLVVATRPLKTFENELKFFSNPTYGIEMNQNVTFGGTPDGVHDGTDKTQWTGSAISGNWTFNLANTHAKDAVCTIIDYSGLATDTVTVTINGSANILTEGSEWNRGANNNAAATSLASAINALTGVSASASAAVVTIIADSGYDITALATSAGADLTVSARAIDGTATVTDRVAQLLKTHINLSNYVAITGYIYITKWTTGKHVVLYGWDTGTGLQVGDAINIDDYIDTGILGSWQKFPVPLTDMSLQASSIDALRVRNEDKDNDFYLDLIQIEETGTPVEFCVEPDVGTWFHVNRIMVTMADALDTTLADASMPSLAYDALLGVSKLTNGLIYQRIQDEEVQESYTVQQIADWLQFPNSRIVNAFGDGTNTFIMILNEFDEPEVLKAENNDKLRILVQDNLSGLLWLRISVGGSVEIRESD